MPRIPTCCWESSCASTWTRKIAGLEYGIPADNPYAKEGGRKEIFAIGVRNPWKWSFDPLNGDLWVGEVGQDKIEEVDLITLGGNYGWKVMEGPQGANDGKMTLPIFSYDHNTGTLHHRRRGLPRQFRIQVLWDLFHRGHQQQEILGPEEERHRPGHGGEPAQYARQLFLIRHGRGRADLRGGYGDNATDGIIYLLESPDLAVSTVNRLRTGSVLGRYSRSFTVSPGARVDASAFALSRVLELFATDGTRLGAVTRENPSLPDNLEPGVYLLRPAEGSALPDLLVVR